jgi:hypothetical protein
MKNKTTLRSLSFQLKQCWLDRKSTNQQQGEEKDTQWCLVLVACAACACTPITDRSSVLLLYGALCTSTQDLRITVVLSSSE